MTPQDFYDIEFIEAYLNGDLNEDQLQRIEKKIAEDLEFAAEIELHKSALIAIKKTAQEQIRNDLRLATNLLDKEGFFVGEDELSAYIRGDLKDSESIRKIERRKQIDQAFAAELELEALVAQSLRKEAQKQIQKDLDVVQDSLKKEGFFDSPPLSVTQPEEKKIRVISILSTKSRVWIAAASVLLIILAVGIFMNKSTGDDIFADYYKVPADVVTPALKPLSGSGAVGLSSIEQTNLGELLSAFDAYQKKDYGRSTKLLKKILNKEITFYQPKEDIELYLAESYLAQNMHMDAILILEGLNTSMNEKFRNRALVSFHLALAYIKVDQKVKAKILLEGLENHASYGTAASEILKALN
ncbi:MAG: hypothetical protein MK212_20125 [Saprospiraceae bacterium]|nr:hypothetical protein [Saprospiraceae bacterium]